jgi:transketolase
MRAGKIVNRPKESNQNNSGENSVSNIQLLKKKSSEIRIDILRMVCSAKGGHIGGSLSCADILIALYFDVLKIDPQNPQWEERDYFILSKGHAVEAYYAVLANRGFFSKEELQNYRKFGSRFIAHPNLKVPGIEMNTGALGHGLAIGVGMALAGKKDQKKNKVYVLMGDGEQDEGSIWEAAMAGAHYKLDNLVGIIDRNGLQMCGDTEKLMHLESLKDKWSAFGWAVKEIDGHDIKKLVQNFKEVPFAAGKPNLIIARTIKGNGISFMQNDAKWHHHVPDAEQMNQALKELECRLEEVEKE